MIYVLCGEDTYRSRKKVREIQNRFYAVAHSRESAYKLSFSECARSQLEELLGTSSLFHGKRLVILEDPQSVDQSSAEFFESKLAQCASSDDVFVIWDCANKKNARGFWKTIIESATKVQEFSVLSVSAAARFLDEELQERGITLSLKKKQELLHSFRGDTWALVQNMEKYALGFDESTRVGSFSKRELTVFSFLDAFGLRQPEQALRLFYQLMQNGIEAERLFWALTGHLRSLLSVDSLIRAEVFSSDIPQRTAIHPFVVKKAARQIRNFSKEELMMMYDRLTVLDFEVKQSHGDLSLGLERILLSL